MDLSSLEIKETDFNDIRDFIKNLEIERVASQGYGNVHIIATISTFDDIEQFMESLEGFKFTIEKRLGKLLIISKISSNKKVYFYVFYDDRNNVPLFITDAKKTNEIPETLFRYINRSKQISNLWIAPKIMKEIKDDLASEFEDMIITYFSARRGPNTDISSEYRPHVERGIQYHGNDGKHTLEEMEYYYGVLPKILEIQLPDGVAFRIDNKGIITLRQGHFEGIFRIIEKVVNRLKLVKDAIGESSYSIYQVGKDKRFNNAIQTPWSIVLPIGIHSDNIPNFCNAVKSEEWNFTVLDQVLFNNSLYFSARLIDGYSGSMIDVSTTGDKLDIYPVGETDIGTSMRFFEFIVENIDHSATVG
jgi:hypothetical protein